MNVGADIEEQGTFPPGLGFVDAPPVDHPAEPGCGQMEVMGSPHVLLDTDVRLTPGSPFHELLVTFVAASAGLTAIFDGEHFPDFLVGIAGVFPGFASSAVTSNLGDVIAQVRGGAIAQPVADNAMCCMLATAAWAALDAGPGHPLWTRPELQFFRHVRNAAAHGNRWHFNDGRWPTPDLPAAWKDFAIDHSLQGSRNPLHGSACFGASLGAADLVRLLRDVEMLLAGDVPDTQVT